MYVIDIIFKEKFKSNEKEVLKLFFRRGEANVS